MNITSMFLASLCVATLAVGSARAATLSGQAFVTAQGGEIVTCAGRDVTIVPDDGGATGSAARHAKCDADGHFLFQGLHTNGWTIHTDISWDVRAKQGVRHLGGAIAHHVVLRSANTEIVLNDRDVIVPDYAPRDVAQAGK